MACILFRLRLVPEDEADDVRGLLTDHHIPWYETSAGRWGLSFPALWVREDEDLPRAKEILAVYQEARKVRLRAEQQQLEESGHKETVVSRLLKNPLQSVAIIAVIAVIMYFSISPFFALIG